MLVVVALGLLSVETIIPTVTTEIATDSLSFVIFSFDQLLYYATR